MVRVVSSKTPLPALAAVAMAVLLSACVPNVDQRGNLPEQDKLAEIHPGTTTKDQVAKILGTPSSTSIFDDKRWYYISRKTKQVAFLDPDVLDQQVFIVNLTTRAWSAASGTRICRTGGRTSRASGRPPRPAADLPFSKRGPAI